MYIFSKYQTWK